MRKFVVVGLLTLLSCSKSRSSSYTKEQIDSANNLLTRYGLAEMPKYDDLLKYKNIHTKNDDGSRRYPWVDNYWPTYQKTLARRWGAIVSMEEVNVSAYDYFIASYFQTQVDVMKTAELTINLAPSEKFDILYRSQQKMRLGSDNDGLKKLFEIEGRHKNLVSNSDDSQDDLEQNKALANDYLNAMNSFVSPETSLKYLSPMTFEGLSNWLENSTQERNMFPGVNTEGANWSWEGICHGWAAAAVMEDEPKHAVRVEFGKGEEARSLIFSEGDIRGLLSKSWAESQNKDQFFIGRRCEENVNDSSLGVPSNEEGRAVTGKLSYKNSSGVFTSTLFTIVQDYPVTRSSKGLARIILENEWVDKNSPKFAYILSSGPSRSMSYQLYFDEKAAFAAVEGLQISDVLGAETRDVKFYGCSDVNPASFHSVLVENIGKKNLGLVMDRTQSGQVWNQPIGAADFEIGPLVPLSDLKDRDSAKAYRAPGTAYIAEVKASVHWGTEPGFARFIYQAESPENDLAYGTDGDLDKTYTTETIYHYTLEFDANQILIGGEWGALGKMKPDVENPDFLFGFSKKSKPGLEQAGYLESGYENIIDKIHACSLSSKIDGTVDSKQFADLQILERKLEYSNCKLD